MPYMQSLARRLQKRLVRTSWSENALPSQEPVRAYMHKLPAATSSQIDCDILPVPYCDDEAMYQVTNIMSAY